MDGPSMLPGHHHAAGRLAAHAAALEQPHTPHFQATQPVFQGHQSPQTEINNWAADFNRFSQNQPQNAFPQTAPQMPMNHAPMNFQSAFPQPAAAFSPVYGSANAGFMGPTTNGPVADAGFDEEMSKWMAVNSNTAGMEQVDAAMEQMARELELNDAALQQDKTKESETLLDTTTSAPLETPDLANLSLEANDPISSEAPESKAKSEIADAAERLLESVQHEDGEKWKNSVFLSLMRDFRDGKKDIVDNEVRETPEHDGADVVKDQ